MRKADYAALSGILRVQIALAVRFNQPSAVAALEAVARRFADAASVDRAAFLRACGIDP
jgi:hypothetical protein